MNPDTHRFEGLDTEDAVKAAHAKGWKVFKLGERVTVNGTDFTVLDISPTKLTLRPYGLALLADADQVRAAGGHK